MFKHRLCLGARDIGTGVQPFIQAHAVFEIVEQAVDGQPRFVKTRRADKELDPFAVDLFTISIVSRLFLDVIDDENGIGAFLRFQFQPELFIDGLEKRGSADRV